MSYFVDYTPLPNKLRVLKSGAIRANALIARVGIQEYNTPKGRIKVLRNPDVVRDSVESLQLLPITLDHPNELLTVENTKDLQIGSTGDNVTLLANGYIKANLTITTVDGVKAVSSGDYKEFSVGYEAALVHTPGIWKDTYGVHGVVDAELHYDAYMTNIEPNHLALVQRARAGNLASFVDSQDLYLNYTGDTDMKNKDMSVVNDAVSSEANMDVSPELEEKDEVIAELTAKIDLLTAELEAARGNNKDDDQAQALDSLKINNAKLTSDLSKMKDSIDSEVEARLNTWAVLRDTLQDDMVVDSKLSANQIKLAYLSKKYPAMVDKLVKMDSVDVIWDFMLETRTPSVVSPITKEDSLDDSKVADAIIATDSKPVVSGIQAAREAFIKARQS